MTLLQSCERLFWTSIVSAWQNYTHLKLLWYTLPETKSLHLVGILVSLWDGLISGAMLFFLGGIPSTNSIVLHRFWWYLCRQFGDGISSTLHPSALWSSGLAGLTDLPEKYSEQTLARIEKNNGGYTLPETNIAHENPIFPDKIPSKWWISHGYVSLQECTIQCLQ